MNSFVPPQAQTNSFVPIQPQMNSFVPPQAQTHSFVQAPPQGNSFVPSQAQVNSYVPTQPQMPSFVPPQAQMNSFMPAHVSQAPPQDVANITTMLNFEAEQRQLDREANQQAMLNVAEQLRENQSQLNSTLATSNRTNTTLTQKAVHQVRTNPPPKFEKGNNLIVHFRTKVENHILEYYNHSRDEQILAIGHVFPENVKRKQLARKIAGEMLISAPRATADRLPVYRAIASKLGERTFEGEFTPLLDSEDIDVFFERSRILVEETIDHDVEKANARVLHYMANPKKQLIPSKLIFLLDNLIHNQLPADWENGVSSENTERILKMLDKTREKLNVSEKQINNVNSFNTYPNQNSAKPTQPAYSQSSAKPAQRVSFSQPSATPAQPAQTKPNLSMTIPTNLELACHHCKRNDVHNKPHWISNCPVRHLCGMCLTFSFTGKTTYQNYISKIPPPLTCPRHSNRNKICGLYDAAGIRKVGPSRNVHNVQRVFPTPPTSVENFVRNNGVNTLESSVAHVNFTQGFLHTAPTPDEFDTGSIFPVSDPSGKSEIPLFCNFSRAHDKFHYLVPHIINCNGDKVEFPMVVDTGCDADGVISQKFVNKYNLGNFINHNRYISVSVANGNTQRCKTLNLSIPLPSKSVNLSLIVLDHCPAGALIGLPGCQKIDPNAISSLMSRLNMSFRPTKN